jgi:hypothetical protein
VDRLFEQGCRLVLGLDAVLHRLARQLGLRFRFDVDDNRHCQLLLVPLCVSYLKYSVPRRKNGSMIFWERMGLTI